MANYSTQHLTDLVFKDYQTGLPLGSPLADATAANFSYDQAIVEQKGGRGNHVVRTTPGEITASLNLTFGSVPHNDILKVALGLTMTERSAESTGAIDGIANKKGASVIKSTGLASITVTSNKETDLKESNYIVKAVSATTVNVYATSDYDFNRGTTASYVNADTRTIAEGITITQGSTSDIAKFGITLTGGAGTIAMTSGDTAVFSVRPVNTSSDSFILGSANAKPQVFTIEARTERNYMESPGSSFGPNTDATQTIVIHKVQGIKYNGNMTQNEIAATEWQLTVLKDQVVGGIATISGYTI